MSTRQERYGAAMQAHALTLAQAALSPRRETPAGISAEDLWDGIQAGMARLHPALHGGPMRKRENPRINRDLPEQEVRDPHPPADETKTDLHQAVHSEGWEVAKRNLRQRIDAIRRRLAVDHTLSEKERLRFIFRHQVFEEMLDDPVSFFSQPGGNEA